MKEAGNKKTCLQLQMASISWAYNMGWVLWKPWKSQSETTRSTLGFINLSFISFLQQERAYTYKWVIIFGLTLGGVKETDFFWNGYYSAKVQHLGITVILLEVRRTTWIGIMMVREQICSEDKIFWGKNCFVTGVWPWVWSVRNIVLTFHYKLNTEVWFLTEFMFTLWCISSFDLYNNPIG